MRSTSLSIFFSFCPADDRPPVGSSARFGFVSMLRLNLAQSLARRGISVTIEVPADETGVDGSKRDIPVADVPTFAVLLRRYRLSAGLSQEALAERARMSVNGLSALERGTRRTPQRETLSLLIEALALSDSDRALFESAARRGTVQPNPRRDESSASGESASADLCIVVATPAWYADDTCRTQLAAFDGADGDAATSNRVFVVRREQFEAAGTIASLADRMRFDFFRDASHARPFEPLYRNDGTPAPAFYDVVDSLAQAVYRHVASGGRAAPPTAGEAHRTVYVAPPTSDMEAPYRTLVAELTSAGYVVLPADPPGTSAVATLDGVDFELADALASIHLLGEDDEFDDAGRSRVSFPLARAAVRANARDDAFRRILFAPKLLQRAGDASDVARDPIAVRDRFAEPLASDTIIGDGIIEFVLAAKDLLRIEERRVRPSSEPAKLAAGSSIFLNFHAGDVQYARAIAKALRERGLRARFAAFEDDKIQNKLTNAEAVRESQAVVHCWANATDAWLYAEAADYEDWRKFGRSQPFLTRAAVAGPPERGSKMLYTAEDPPEAIDVYVDLTSRDVPLGIDLDPIVATVTEPRQS
jgi:transcriptional regulator with XRE-family HTH domain